MNRLVMFCAGLLLMSSMTGCCLMHGYGCGGGGYPSYGGGGGCGGCNNGCGVAAPGYPSAMMQGGQMAYAPMGGYPTSAMAPVEALPTFQ